MMLLLPSLLSISLMFFGWLAPVKCSPSNLFGGDVPPPPPALLGTVCSVSEPNSSCQPNSVYYCGERNAGREEDIYRIFPNHHQCLCHSDYFPFWPNKTCLLKATRTGDPRQVNEQCTAKLGSSAMCSSDGVCVCKKTPSYSKDDDGSCLLPPGPGTKCHSSSDCIGFPEFSECRTQSIHFAYLFSDSSYPDSDNSVHFSKTCQCRSGIGVLSSNGEECLPVRERLGMPCTEHVQCFPSHLHRFHRERYYGCINSSCSCVSNAIHEPNRDDECYLKASYIGQECQVDVQCQANLGPSSTCSRLHSQNYNIYTCANGSVPINNFTGCGSGGPVPIGWPCEKSQTYCSGQKGSSLCTAAGVCECEPGHIPSKLLDACLPIRNLWDECQESAQCQVGTGGENSECVNVGAGASSEKKICKCAIGWIQPSGESTCFKVASVLGDPCEKRMQCVVGLGASECVNKVCRCVPGAKMSGWSPIMRRCIAI